MTNSLSIQKKLLLLTLLTSVTTLTACGQKEAQTVPASKASAAAKVISKSSSSATAITGKPSSSAIAVTTPSTLAEAEVEEEVTEASSEEVVVDEENAEALTEPEVTSHAAPAEVTALPTTFDLNALASGDYSSIAGTWANAKGEVFTVSSDGEMTVQRTGGDSFTVHMRASGITETGYVYGGVGSYHGDDFWSNAVIAIVPAGAANILGEVVEQDHIEIGHGVHAAYPEEQYFRQ